MPAVSSASYSASAGLSAADRGVEQVRRFHWSLLPWLCLTIAILVAAGALGYQSLSKLVENGRRVAQTHEVLDALDSTFSALKDVEAAGRGFVITGREHYLAPYYTALPQIDGSLAAIQRLTANNLEQQQRIPVLKSAVAHKLAVSRRIVEARRDLGEADATRLVLSGEGKAHMDKVREAIGAMRELELQRLAARARELDAATSRSMLAIGAGLATSFAVLFLIFYLVLREGRRRAKAEAQLAASNHELERSVQAVQALHSEVSAVSALSDLLQSCYSMSEAREVVGRSMPKLFPTLSGSLSLVNSSGNLVETALSWGKAGGAQNVFAPDDCWALRRGRPHLVDDDARDVVCAHQARGGGAHLCCPIIAQGETAGVLCLHAASVAELTESAQRLAHSVAEQISLALANLRLQESLRVQSIRDPLTGLYNRRHMEPSLERELARARRQAEPVSILMCDLDHFKRFNDTYGHAAGDALLAEFGRLLKANCRAEDIPCRYGGEEFMLILPGTDAEVAQRRAEAICGAVRQLVVRHRDQALGPVSVSIGLAVYSQQGCTSADLQRQADAALYQAKQAGRDRVVLATSPLPSERTGWPVVPRPAEGGGVRATSTADPSRSGAGMAAARSAAGGRKAL